MTTDITTIIAEYNKLKEDTEKRISSMKKDIDNHKNDELMKARNKIYDYFEKIQDTLPSDFKLTVKINIALESLNDKTDIILEKNNILLNLSGPLSFLYYSLSRKNKDSKYGRFNRTIYELTKETHIINMIKNWNEIKNNIELEIQKYFEKCINKKINEISDDIGVTKLLEEFNI